MKKIWVLLCVLMFSPSGRLVAEGVLNKCVGVNLAVWNATLTAFSEWFKYEIGKKWIKTELLGEALSPEYVTTYENVGLLLTYLRDAKVHGHIGVQFKARLGEMVKDSLTPRSRPFSNRELRALMVKVAIEVADYYKKDKSLTIDFKVMLAPSGPLSVIGTPLKDLYPDLPPGVIEFLEQWNGLRDTSRELQNNQFFDVLYQAELFNDSNKVIGTLRDPLYDGIHIVHIFSLAELVRKELYAKHPRLDDMVRPWLKPHPLLKGDALEPAVQRFVQEARGRREHLHEKLSQDDVIKCMEAAVGSLGR